MYIYSSSTYTQTGTFAWGILVIIQSNECDQWVHVSYFIPPLSEIYIYVVTLYISSIYLVPGVYTTAWQALNRCVFQYKQTKTWRANKEDSKCLTQHEKFQKKKNDIHVSPGESSDYWHQIYMKGSMPVTLPYIFDILLIKGVLTLRYDNQGINVKFFQKQINVFF